MELSSFEGKHRCDGQGQSSVTALPLASGPIRRGSGRDQVLLNPKSPSTRRTSANVTRIRLKRAIAIQVASGSTTRSQ
jgi:hypothetical protein